MILLYKIFYNSTVFKLMLVFYLGLYITSILIESISLFMCIVFLTAVSLYFYEIMLDSAVILFENKTYRKIPNRLVKSVLLTLRIIPTYSIKVHSLNGPAVMASDNRYNRYYIYGDEISKQTFLKIKKIKNKSDLTLYLFSNNPAERKLAEHKLKELSNAKNYFNFNWINQLRTSRSNRKN